MKIIEDLKSNEKFSAMYNCLQEQLKYQSQYTDKKVEEFFIGLMNSNADQKVKEFFLDGTNHSKSNYNKVVFNGIVSYVTDFSIFGDKAIDYIKNSQLENKVKGLRYLFCQEKDSNDIPDDLFIWVGSLLRDQSDDGVRNSRMEFFKYLVNYNDEIYKKLLFKVLLRNTQLNDSYYRLSLSIFLSNRRYYDKTDKNDIEYAKLIKKYISFDMENLDLKCIDKDLDPSFEFLVELNHFKFLYDYIDKRLYGLSHNHWKFESFRKELELKFPNDPQKYTELMALPNIFYKKGVARQFKKSKYAGICKLLKYNKEDVLKAIHRAYFKEWS